MAKKLHTEERTENGVVKSNFRFTIDKANLPEGISLDKIELWFSCEMNPAFAEAYTGVLQGLVQKIEQSFISNDQNGPAVRLN